MATFKVMIDTSNYKPCKDETTNSIMYALNGWNSIEHNYNEVLWRLRDFAGYGLFENEWNKWGSAYLKWHNRKNNKIIISNNLQYRVEIPVIAMGYIDCNKLVEQLKRNGKTTFDFSELFDLRQGRVRNFKGCYMEIIKIN